jgi:hypothetical protein
MEVEADVGRDHLWSSLSPAMRVDFGLRYRSITGGGGVLDSRNGAWKQQRRALTATGALVLRDPRAEPPVAGDLFALQLEDDRLYFEVVQVKRKLKMICQGEVFGLKQCGADRIELDPEGFYPRLNEPFVKENSILLSSLEEMRRMQKSGAVALPSTVMEGLASGGKEDLVLTAMHSLEDFEDEVRSTPSLWCDGTGPEDSPLTEDQQALLTSGELLALATGLRGLCLLQVSLPLEMGGSKLPLLRPFVFQLLRKLHQDSRVGIYPSKVEGASSLVLAAKRQPFTAWAGYLSSLGVQASLVADSEFYKMIIGIMMGYKMEHIEHHIASTSGKGIDNKVRAAVEEELRGLSSSSATLPWK